jgi:hypothetical protein
MNKKSGTAGSPVTPTDPQDALEADLADPGEMAKVKAEELKTQSGKYGQAPVKPLKADAEDDHDPEKKKSWIEIELVDQDKKPVPGEPYRITLPDGETVAEGTLDEKGFARLDGIDPGTCKITFPNLDKDAWKALS